MIKKTLLALAASFTSAVFAGPTGTEWQEPENLSLGKEPTRAAFSSFDSEEEALKILPEFAKRQLSLDSDTAWKFHWSPDPESRPKAFWMPEFDISQWETIKVPCSWQAMGANGKGGWGTALYTNIRYPFAKDAPSVMGEPPTYWTSYAARNPVGSYRRDFEVPAEWDGKDVFLKFDGVDSFFYLWVNGEYVGFSKDSRSPAEFNVTHYVKSGKNTVALEVYRYSDGSYLEDQDMFRLSGIFRRTWLIARPQHRVRDFFVTAKPVEEGKFDGDWKVSVDVQSGVTVALYDWSGRLLVRTDAHEFVVQNPLLWSAERPYCYKVVIGNGEEFVSSLFGFRVSEIKNGRYYLNGQKIKIKGANRHETDPMYGHWVSMARHEQDIKTLKDANCNAVRNCHYPQDDYWYYLCDTEGIYLCDEANVESHGYGYDADSISHKPEWKKATVARDMAMVERNKNHPSVVIWSYGNEAGPGENFAACQAAIGARDKTRPTHYERDWSVADMDACQYPSVEWVAWKATDTNAVKPFYISEYAHNMGNAMGDLEAYQDLIESSDVILGATIWDWIDQGLYKMTKDGKRIVAYGGDFGDKPNDGFFVMNGCLLSDRTPEPCYGEIKHVYQNWKVRANDDFTRIIVRNKNYFVNADGVTCLWTLYRDGEVVASDEFNLRSLGPQKEWQYAMPAAVEIARERGSVLALRFRFLENGRTIASDQIDFPVVKRDPIDAGVGRPVAMSWDGGVKMSARGLTVLLDRETGLPKSIIRYGKELVRTSMKLDAFRSPSSNEMSPAAEWKRLGLDKLTAKAVSLSPLDENTDGSISFDIENEWKGADAGDDTVSFKVKAHWRVFASGVIACTSRIMATGKDPGLARIGYAFEMDDANPSVEWLGRGPFENYADRKSGAFVGKWRDEAKNFFFPYGRNEDSGNREDTWGVRVGGLAFRTLGDPFAFEVNPYNAAELMAKGHPDELEASDKTFVGIFAKVRGLGGASCGPEPREDMRVNFSTEHKLDFTISCELGPLSPRALNEEVTK